MRESPESVPSSNPQPEFTPDIQPVEKVEEAQDKAENQDKAEIQDKAENHDKAEYSEKTTGRLEKTSPVSIPAKSDLEQKSIEDCLDRKEDEENAVQSHVASHEDNILPDQIVKQIDQPSHLQDQHPNHERQGEHFTFRKAVYGHFKEGQIHLN